MVTRLAGTRSALAGFGEAKRPTWQGTASEGRGPPTADGLRSRPMPREPPGKTQPQLPAGSQPPPGDRAQDPGKPRAGARGVQTDGTHRGFSHQDSGGLCGGRGCHTRGRRKHLPVYETARHARAPTLSSLSALCLRASLPRGAAGGARPGARDGSLPPGLAWWEVGTPDHISRRVGRDHGAMRSGPSAARRQVGPARPRWARDSAAACAKLSEGSGWSPAFLSKPSSRGDQAPAAGPAPGCRVTLIHSLLPASVLPTANWG